jgi:hypothetical protein
VDINIFSDNLSTFLLQFSFFSTSSEKENEGVPKSILREKEELPHQYTAMSEAARYCKNPRDFSISGGLF